MTGNATAKCGRFARRLIMYLPHQFTPSTKQWTHPHWLRGGPVLQDGFGTSQRKKNPKKSNTEGLSASIVHVAPKRITYTTHKTTTAKIQMACSQFTLQTTFSLCYCRQVLLGRKCGALISPRADSTGCPPASVWSWSRSLPLQNL